MFKQLILASNNKGKLEEFQQLFAKANLPIEVIAQGQLHIEDAIEDGLSFIENALIKARHASRISGLPALADDSGVCVPVLNGQPGIYSARYGQDMAGYAEAKDDINNQKLLKNLASLRGDKPIIGQFVCVLALVRHADDPLPLIAQGIWQGEILANPLGEHGFGYDPLFWLPEHQKTAAQMTKAGKNQVSHRGLAMQQLLKQIQATPEFNA